MPNDFIIKPATIIPSTFSQIGSALIPSKKCNNRKIVRKYTEKGATSVLSTDTGLRSVSGSYISTSKRFDRPSPMISSNCQPCTMLTIPSVTDKTAYPCSLGKYSVTGYFNVKNRIDPNYTYSSYPRIITSNNQLYQQYRVTDKNNIVKEIPNSCPDCQYEIETGIYQSIDDKKFDLYVINKGNCELCTFLPDASLFGSTYQKGCLWKDDANINIEIIGNNQIKIIDGSGSGIIFNLIISTTSFDTVQFVTETNVVLEPLEGSCTNIQEFEISQNGNTLTIKNLINNVEETFTQAAILPGSPNDTLVVYSNNQEIFYFFGMTSTGNSYELNGTLICNCAYERIKDCPDC